MSLSIHLYGNRKGNSENQQLGQIDTQFLLSGRCKKSGSFENDVRTSTLPCRSAAGVTLIRWGEKVQWQLLCGHSFAQIDRGSKKAIGRPACLRLPYEDDLYFWPRTFSLLQKSQPFSITNKRSYKKDSTSPQVHLKQVCQNLSCEVRWPSWKDTHYSNRMTDTLSCLHGWSPLIWKHHMYWHLLIRKLNIYKEHRTRCCSQRHVFVLSEGVLMRIWSTSMGFGSGMFLGSTSLESRARSWKCGACSLSETWNTVRTRIGAHVILVRQILLSTRRTFEDLKAEDLIDVPQARWDAVLWCAVPMVLLKIFPSSFGCLLHIAVRICMQMCYVDLCRSCRFC